MTIDTTIYVQQIKPGEIFSQRHGHIFREGLEQNITGVFVWKGLVLDCEKCGESYLTLKKCIK